MNLEDKNKFKDLVLSSISHEIRTPLNVIYTSLGLIKEEIIPMLLDCLEKIQSTYDIAPSYGRDNLDITGLKNTPGGCTFQKKPNPSSYFVDQSLFAGQSPIREQPLLESNDKVVSGSSRELFGQRTNKWGVAKEPCAPSVKNRLINVSKIIVENMVLLSENLNVIFRSVEEYILLVDSLLDYCLILNERFTVKIRRSKLSDSVQKVINIVQDKISAKKLYIKVKTKNLIPELWNTDQLRFEQVIFALLSNSIKFTYAAEISIKFHYFEDHDIMKITVKDHGCGMDQ